MNCKICGGNTSHKFTTKVLYKYDVAYFQCDVCHFGQTEQPYWLEESYQSPMNLSDTGVMLRCERLSKITTTLIALFFKSDGQFLDYAGGYGVFTRAMRDIGFDYYWNDPYTPNLIARGFDGKMNRQYEMVTTFESFEHFEDPMGQLEKILLVTDNVVFTTDLAPNPIAKNWWYIAPEHGQHIAFHSKESLKEMAKKYGLHFYNAKNVHVFTRKKLGVFATLFFKLPISKHLLYLGYFFVNPFLRSRSVSDMNSFYIREEQR